MCYHSTGGMNMFDLLNELKYYIPLDEAEKNNVEKVIEFLKNNTNSFSRTNLAGHITAGGLVVDMKGNVLLNHHKKADMWFQFGGHCDGESNLLNVARREVFEESGLDNLQLISNQILDVDVHIIDYSAKKNEPEHFHYDVNFLFKTENLNFKISNESAEIKWVSIDEAKKLIDHDDLAMRRMLKKYQNILNKDVELHVPAFEDLWFRKECMSDPQTMHYNAGYDVHYDGYHFDTGCIDFPEDEWQSWVEKKLNNPNFFYAYIVSNNQFVGYVNFNKNPETNNATMGIVIKSEHQGKGCMRPAMKKLIEKAKEHGVKCLTDTVLENRENALKVFYDLGFEKTGEFKSKKFDKEEVVAEISKEL